MVLLDSNIFIYLANGSLDASILKNEDISHSVITEIETLGYSELKANELIHFSNLFETSISIPLSKSIVSKAIELRQHKKMSLGDSIIAATAIVNNIKLWTANSSDFNNISGLSIYDPR